MIRIGDLATASLSGLTLQAEEWLLRSMRIHYGTLETTMGEKAISGEWTLLACSAELAGHSFGASHRLAEHVQGKRIPAVLKRPINEKYDAVWVRARLPRVFQYQPGLATTEKALIAERFAAVRGDDAYLFECSDHYGKTSLWFSDEGPDEPTKAGIASAFWSLLLNDPDDLEDFVATVYHVGAGVWLHYRCADGNLSLDETQEQ